MKWRLSSDSLPQKEISDTRSMSFATNERSEVISRNKFSPSSQNKLMRDEAIKSNENQSYKPRTSGDILADQMKMQQASSRQQQYNNRRGHFPTRHHPKQRQSIIEDTFKTDPNNSSIYIISNNSNQIVEQNGSTSWTNNIHPQQPSSGTGKSSNNTSTTVTANFSTGIPLPSSNTSDDMTRDLQTKNNYNSSNHHDAANNDFHYVTQPPSSPSPGKNLSTDGSFNIKNGSTAKLLPVTNDDESSIQTKCSVFRGLVLCICLNVTYANVVRFPRELDRFGLAYLIPYLVLLFLVGLPITLLEISVGQFLGQGAAHTWRSSPIFKGACIASRFASWLASVWVSLQAVMAIVYIGMFSFKSLPFNDCVGDIRIAETGYKILGNNGQDCIQKTFLTPVWENPLYFGLLMVALVFLWMIVMLCTHNAKVFRRVTFFFGLLGFALLSALAGWEVHRSVEQKYFPELWLFNENLLINSSIWFNALVQVIYSTNIGFGALPVITGKFLYKGDAVRTTVVYLCFNLLVSALALTLFMVQFDNIVTRNATIVVGELKPLTSIYDNVLYEADSLLVRLIPSLMYALIMISSIVTITVAIYTSSRLVPRHPNYIMSLIAMVVAVVSLVAPKFTIPRIMETRIIGALVVSALIFDLIAMTWVYGAKNIYTDLEFSIGRPIWKSWLVLWCLAPVILTAVLVWWCIDFNEFDLLSEYVPRYAPIAFVLILILIIACIEIFKQVDYNFFGMIGEAAKSAKEWGPADPLARHAWKQWRSVCQDTGRKDFTLRRRGTRDYTHSIKKGQYSTSKYGTQNWKSSSTPGSSSPNYSGSVFGDSAIEEDMSVDKYSGINNQFTAFQNNDSKPLRYSSGRSQQNSHESKQRVINNPPPPPPDRHKEIVYIRRLSNDNNNHATRIEITPSNESITYGSRNPMGRTSTLSKDYKTNINSNQDHKPPNPPLSVDSGTNSADHICWRKFSVNTDEYSTEL